jgi:hypothetical protein
MFDGRLLLVCSSFAAALLFFLFIILVRVYYNILLQLTKYFNRGHITPVNHIKRTIVNYRDTYKGPPKKPKHLRYSISLKHVKQSGLHMHQHVKHCVLIAPIPSHPLVTIMNVFEAAHNLMMVVGQLPPDLLLPEQLSCNCSNNSQYVSE